MAIGYQSLVGKLTKFRGYVKQEIKILVTPCFSNSLQSLIIMNVEGYTDLQMWEDLKH